MNDKESPFAAIFGEDDELGLLAVKRSGPTRSSEDDIALAQFEAINVFVDEHGVLPGSMAHGREPSLNEYTLEGYLDTFRNGAAYHDLLGPYDRHNLLGMKVMAPSPSSISEIIASNDPLLAESTEQIFDLRHVPSPGQQKSKPDEVAKRRPCEKFEKYEPIFVTLNADLASGRRITKRFEREGSIIPGAAFVLNGIMAYIADVSEPQRRGKETDARIRVIFGNGMESNHLLRSFARVLYEDDNGRQIIEAAPSVSGPLFSGADHVAGPLFTGEAQRAIDDRYTGNIYVVESLSDEPAIAGLRGRLFKIGFTTQSVEKRLSNVEADPTFLLAPVRIVTVFETVNLNPHKLEQLIHQFFGQAQLQVDVLLGRRVSPKEWFVVPLEFVREAINRILDGTIVKYRYDHLSRKIVER